MEGGPPKTRALAVLVAALAAAAGCATAPNVGTTAASMLGHVRDSNDPNVRYVAYSKLGSSRVYDDEKQKAEAVKLLASRLVKAKEPYASRAVICHTLGELKHPEARDALLRATSDPEPLVRAAACRALGACGKAEDCTTLARIMAVDERKDVQVAAIEGLATLKAPDPRIDSVLLDGMESNDPAVRLASYDALCAIVGKDYGRDPKGWKKPLGDRAQAAELAKR